MMRLLIAAPFLLLLVLFALSNTQTVRLGIWPTDYVIDVPLALAVLVAMAVAFLFGALIVWMSAIGQRRRARRAERLVQRLEDQVEELRARQPQPTLPPPG